jgi:hypothetical protein
MSTTLVAYALWEAARVPLGRFSAGNLARFAVIHPGRFAGQSPETAVPPCERPEDLMVIVAGGPGKHAAIVPTFGSTRPITARVEA